MQTQTIDPQLLSTVELHGLLLTAVAPRPIALASTVDINGKVNLSPFSFFNVFSANPPILIFSPARRVRDNTTKHTLENALATKQVVIQVVNYAMVEQMSLSSTEYETGINEFKKAGFTAIPSELVTPPRVGEAPVAFECKVTEVKSLGTDGGAGNLIFCEVSKIHVQTKYLDESGKLDTKKLDLVARMGGSWYNRVIPESLFEIPKPIATKGIGVDSLPEHIRNSNILTGNNLGRLGNNEKIPSRKAIDTFLAKNIEIAQYITEANIRKQHEFVQEFLKEGQITEALIVAFA